MILEPATHPQHPRPTAAPLPSHYPAPSLFCDPRGARDPGQLDRGNRERLTSLCPWEGHRRLQARNTANCAFKSTLPIPRQNPEACRLLAPTGVFRETGQKIGNARDCYTRVP